MPSGNNRTRRVGELIQRELATLLAREVKDPRLALISITAVDVSRDLSLAKVFYTIINTSADDENSEAFMQNSQLVQQGLNKASGFLRYELGQRIQLRTIPRLEFRFDDSVIHGAHLSRLIDEVIENDKQRYNQDEDTD